MGRKKIVLTDQEHERRKSAGCRIKQLRKKLKFTQQELADKLHIGASTLKTYETGLYEMPFEVITLLVNLAKTKGEEIRAEYLSGYSSIKTDQEYMEWYSENWPYSELECDGGNPEHDKYMAERQAKAEIGKIRRIMFNALGYEYEADGMGSYDFLGVAPGTEAPKDACVLSELNTSGPSYYFSEAEMDAIIATLKDQIAFACFKKSRT